MLLVKAGGLCVQHTYTYQGIKWMIYICVYLSISASSHIQVSAKYKLVRGCNLFEANLLHPERFNAVDYCYMSTDTRGRRGFGRSLATVFN